MELSHKRSILKNLAMQRLEQFVRKHEKQWNNEVPDLEQYERELHERMMDIECELLGEELSRYDMSVEQIEVEGEIYRPTLTSSETYLSGGGLVRVERHLYRPVGRGSKSICPMELRAGIVAGYFTPRAARQAAFVTAQLTPGESEALFAELEGMRPSRASLDRLPKTLSAQWEEHRQKREASLRAQETVPLEASIMAISVDGVMAPMKAGAEKRKAKQSEVGKHASGPSGNQEVGCGTVVLYNADGERVQTLRYGRMPERKKASLQEQLYAEVASIVALRPDLVRVHLADGAKDNWRLMDEIEQRLSLPSQTCVEILDFYHACEHLKKACDAAWEKARLAVKPNLNA